MKWPSLFALVLTGLILLGINGCYGPAPGNNPTVSLTLDPTAPYMLAGQKLVITGSYSSNPDQIISAIWSANPNVGSFLIELTNSLSNTWIAPSLALGQTENVTLTLTVKTLNGGLSVTHELVKVVTVVPEYTFNTAAMASQVPTFPQIPSGTDLTIAGTAGFNGTPSGDSIATYQWSATAPGSASPGAFSNPASPNPIWMAPSLAATDQPYPVTLNVLVTSAFGIQENCTLTLTVTH